MGKWYSFMEFSCFFITEGAKFTSAGQVSLESWLSGLRLESRGMTKIQKGEHPHHEQMSWQLPRARDELDPGLQEQLFQIFFF